MTDQVKLSCTFTNNGALETVSSPEFNLYTCSSGINIFGQQKYPLDIVLDQNSNGNFTFYVKSRYVI